LDRSSSFDADFIGNHQQLACCSGYAFAAFDSVDIICFWPGTHSRSDLNLRWSGSSDAPTLIGQHCQDSISHWHSQVGLRDTDSLNEAMLEFSD